jgi:hypothetical protein
MPPLFACHQIWFVGFCGLPGRWRKCGGDGGRRAGGPHLGPPPGLGQAGMPRAKARVRPQPRPGAWVGAGANESRLGRGGVEDLCKFDHERRGKTGNDVTQLDMPQLKELMPSPGLG